MSEAQKKINIKPNLNAKPKMKVVAARPRAEDSSEEHKLSNVYFSVGALCAIMMLNYIPLGFGFLSVLRVFTYGPMAYILYTHLKNTNKPLWIMAPLLIGATFEIIPLIAMIPMVGSFCFAVTIAATVFIKE